MSDNPAKNIFVFVVCGDDKHVSMLNVSIKYLRFFSKNPIIVVTDSKRNSLKIEHDQVLNIETPANYDHHQASIWLKTSLYKLLPEGNNYCYLDTDVIALSPQVDNIFNYFSTPIKFAFDHCSLNFFSSAAVNCPCNGIFQERKKRFSETLNDIISGYDFDKDYNNNKSKIITNRIESAINSPLKNLSFLTKLYLRKILPSLFAPRINHEIYYSRKNKSWIDKNGVIVFHEIMDYYPEIKKRSNFRLDRIRSKWYIKGEGEVFDSMGCVHLLDLIKKKFNINITNSNWQHWNGGVFLFNDESKEFMNSWHNMTLEIFKDPDWKTRDQGALAATVWKMGLQNQECLPENFNFLADFNNPQITAYINSGVLIAKKGYKVFQPAFIHVYHKFGYRGWDVWDAIEKINPDRIEESVKNFSSDNKKVHGLWIGSKLSSIELLCIYSFLKNEHEFHLWVYDKIETPLPSGVILEDASKIIPREQAFCYKNKNQYGHGKGSYAGFSDIFRYKLLYQYGGWWSDMDVVCLKPLDFHEPYVFRTHHDFPVVGNIMKCPSGSELMKRCYKQAYEDVTADNTDWNLPIRILNKNIEELQLKMYIYEISNPDNWNFIKKLLLRKIKIPSNWYVLHLINEEWRKNHINKNAIPQFSFIGETIREFGLDLPTSFKEKWINYFRIIFTNKPLKHIYWFVTNLFWKTLRIFFKEKK